MLLCWAACPGALAFACAAPVVCCAVHQVGRTEA